eukprot:272728_1
MISKDNQRKIMNRVHHYIMHTSEQNQRKMQHKTKHKQDLFADNPTDLGFKMVRSINKQELKMNEIMNTSSTNSDPHEAIMFGTSPLDVDINTNPIHESISEKEDKLQALINYHNLNNNLYKILYENHIDLDMLQSDIPTNEIDEFCDEYNIKSKEKESFVKLMDILKPKPTHKMKLMIIGTKGVGKRSLIHRYIYGTFNSNIKLKNPVFVLEQLSDDSSIQIQISQTTNIEDKIDADVVLLCYDVNDRKTFRKLCKNSYDNVIVILVGCKSDKIDRINQNKMALFIMNIPKWNKLNGMSCECSSKSGDNVTNIFRTAAEMVLQKRKQPYHSKSCNNKISNSHLPANVVRFS